MLKGIDGPVAAHQVEAIFDRYKSALYSLALSRCPSKEDAEDVVQEVFVALCLREEPFADDEHLKAWLLRATIHRSLNRRRYEARHPRVPYDQQRHADSIGSEEDLELPVLSRSWQRDDLRAAIEGLPESMQTALSKHYEEGYSAKEIAEQEGVAESTVRARLHRARQRIGKQLAAAAALVLVLVCVLAPFGNVSSNIQEAFAISFEQDNQLSVASLDAAAIQKGDDGVVVTIPVTLTWSAADIEQVTYSINVPEASLYAPATGNYMFLDGGSDKRAVQYCNGKTEVTLNVEVRLSDGVKDQDFKQIEQEAREALLGGELAVEARSSDGSISETSCIFVSW